MMNWMQLFRATSERKMVNDLPEAKVSIIAKHPTYVWPHLSPPCRPRQEDGDSAATFAQGG